MTFDNRIPTCRLLNICCLIVIVSASSACQPAPQPDSSPTAVPTDNLDISTPTVFPTIEVSNTPTMTLFPEPTPTFTDQFAREQLLQFDLRYIRYSEIAWSPDNSQLAISVGYDQEKDSTISIWDVRNSRLIREFAVPKTITTLDWTQNPETNRSILAAGTGYGGVLAWDATTGSLVYSVDENGENILSVKFSPDGESIGVGRLGTLTGGAAVSILDAATGEIARKFPDDLIVATNMQHVYSLAWSPDSKDLAVFNGDQVIMWDQTDLRHTRKLETGWNQSIDWSPKGNLLAVGSYLTGYVTVWDVKQGKPLYQLSFGTVVQGVDFSPDGRVLAVGLYSGEILLIDTSTGIQKHTFQTGYTFFAVRWSSEGYNLAALVDGNLSLWENMEP